MSILYQFKNIQTIHTQDQLIDIVLSKTQRKTPTEVHPGYAISRIRSFYMRKIKFCSEEFNERMSLIVQQFPQLNDIHPFFADLLNILYDKDHYKVALSQINVVKTVINKICNDYLKLIKFSDSLYRCKQLKISAFGWMCTAIKRIGPSLVYLEEVRKHIGRLPSIDPYLPTILFFGYPNVGKSSLINCITKAKVEISSMPFSTQNLYIGHTEYKNVKIQCIDSPGVLDRPLQQRNNIEMQSITALAHLKTVIIFLIDISETCGYSIENQIKLFNGLKPLLDQQLVFVGLNKVDLQKIDQLDNQSQVFLQEFQQENQNVEFIELSCQQDELVQKMKEKVCLKLLEKWQKEQIRKNNKLQNDEDYYRGNSVYQPKNQTRQIQTHIPQSVLEEKRLCKKEQIKTLQIQQEEQGGPGVFYYPIQEHFQLENQDWQYDIVPEIVDGKNIFDFVDPEIEQKLQKIEQEFSNMIIPEEELLNEQEKYENKVLNQVWGTVKINKIDSKLNNNWSVSKGKINISSLKDKLQQKGIESKKVINRLKEKVKNKDKFNNSHIEDTKKDNRLSHRQRWNQEHLDVEKKRRKIQKKFLKDGQKGEADRHVYNLWPKHLLSGKIGKGVRDRR